MPLRHFRFAIEGPPPLKRRARGRTFYTPTRTKLDEARVREAFTSLYGVIRSERPFQVEIHMYFTQPKSSKFDFPAEDGDNIEKAIMDGLNKALWEDDRQVTGMSWFKHFAWQIPELYEEGVWVNAHEL